MFYIFIDAQLLHLRETTGQFTINKNYEIIPKIFVKEFWVIEIFNKFEKKLRFK